MKIKLLLGLFLMVGMLSCEKSEKEPDTPEAKKADYFPLSTDSYWVYNTYKIDSLDNETLISENDTLTIIGDTTINGDLFSVFFGKRFGMSNNKYNYYYRDSSGYIVTPSGKIIFSSNNFTDTLHSTYTPNADDPMLYWFIMMEEFDEEVTLPAGAFDSVLNMNQKIFYYNPSKEFLKNNKHLYAPNVGKILQQYFYVGGYINKKSYYEDRLIGYKIEK